MGCELDRLFLSIEDYKKTSSKMKIDGVPTGKTLKAFIKESSQKNGICISTIKSRLYRDKAPLEKAILPTEEYIKCRKQFRDNVFTYNGESLYLREWAEKYNITFHMLKNRIYRDRVPFDKALLSKEDYHKYRMEQKNKKKEGILDE